MEIADKVDAIEHSNVHFGQAMNIIADLKLHGCAVDASLTIKRLPTSAALVDRARIQETRSAASLDPCIRVTLAAHGRATATFLRRSAVRCSHDFDAHDEARAANE